MARYVTYYEEYPIYEPAEGGYYYTGNEVISYKKLSHNQAKKEMARIWEDCKKENLEEFGEEVPWKYDTSHHHTPWMYLKNSYVTCIYRRGRYIGEGESYVLERKLGSETSSWHPYC